MTIKIEREALLSLTDTQRDSILTRGFPVISFGLDYLPTKACPPPPELDDTDDDSTVSSCSSSTTTSTVKCVSFAAPLVTEVRYRPRTLRRNKTLLYYTVEQTSRFRQEYREERSKLKLEEDSSDIPSNHASQSGEPSSDNQSSGESQGNLDDTQANNHRITKVVVKHNNTLETFIHNEMDSAKSPKQLPSKFKTANDDFFDNDSFWNGEITWY